MNSPDSPFRSVLIHNVKSTIRRLRKEGTVSTSVACLRNIVPTPSPALEGAPKGDFVQVRYNEIFAGVCAEYAKNFIEA